MEKNASFTVAENGYKKINIGTLFLLHFSDHLRLFYPIKETNLKQKQEGGS